MIICSELNLFVPATLLDINIILNKGLLLFPFASRLSAGQATTMFSCDACTLNPATTTIAAVSNAVAGTVAVSPPNSYIVFTAYSITSAYQADGVCATREGIPVGIRTPLSVTRPATADANAFRSSAIAAIVDFLNITTCENGVAPLVNLPNETASALAILGSNTLAPATLETTLTSATSSASPSQSPARTPLLPTISPARKDLSHGLLERDKAAIGVVVPVFIIFSFLCGVFYVRRYRKRNMIAKSRDDIADSSLDTQPYLQSKAELDGEERRRLELDAPRKLRYEMNGADARYEAEGATHAHEIAAEGPGRGLHSLGLTHELRGEEHSKELEGQGIL